MCDSSVALRQRKLKAIHEAISDGRLTAEQIHKSLLEEITKELNKPQEEVDIVYVNACQDFLFELNCTRNRDTPSHYTENLLVIRERICSHSFFSSHKSLTRFAIVFSVLVIMFCSSLMMPEGWIVFRQSDDEGQFIMQGLKVPEELLSVAKAGPSLENLGVYTTTNWEEVVQLLGGIPMVPHWMPIGWSIQQYNVILTETSSSLSIVYIHENSGELISYTYYVLFDYDLYMLVEQDKEGDIESLNDGRKVYITKNINRFTASWNLDHIEFLLTGNMSKEHLIKIIESVK